MDPPGPPVPPFSEDEHKQYVEAGAKLLTELGTATMGDFRRKYASATDEDEWSALNEEVHDKDMLKVVTEEALGCLGPTHKLRVTTDYSAPTLTRREDEDYNVWLSHLTYTFEAICSNGFTTHTDQCDEAVMRQDFMRVLRGQATPTRSSGTIEYKSGTWARV